MSMFGGNGSNGDASESDDSGDNGAVEESNGEYDTTGTVEESSSDEGGIFPGIPMESDNGED